MRSNKYLIGIDIGTSGTKTAIFNDDGDLISESFQESKLYYPEPGAVEQDMNEIYYSVIDTIKDCLQRAQSSNLISPKDIFGISIDGQMAGICAVDNNWQPVIPYDSWLDTRCSDYITILNSVKDKVISLSGGPPTFSHGPKMLWWKNERPDIFRKISKFIMPSAYVAGEMAGLKSDEAFIDYTYIHFSCFADILNNKWSEDLCNEFNLPANKLPKIIKPWEIIGKVNKETANITGLLEGTPIAAGCGDQAANILGAAINDSGMIFDVAGTASVFSICVDKYVPDVKNKTLLTARTVLEDLWYAIAYINGGGLDIRWFRDEIIKNPDIKDINNIYIMQELFNGKEYEIFDNLASKISAGSEKLFFIPHLGGRVCPNDPNLKGSWVGLTWRHKKEHLYRSILESIAYEYLIYLKVEKSLITDLKVKEARVIGGGSKSKFWNQLKANVLNLPYVKLKREEFGVLGSAILAGFATGIFTDLKNTANKFNEINYILEPQEQIVDLYKKYSSFYEELLQDTNLIFKKLKNLP
ncbi:MAG: FGGY family carbohydrate kinase [Actinobacteria bacterium]|nr:FGGY family carbohydrate kinase [Cyanobacteriota bacterium]MCL5770818.1 FGGY family carbohydrate kinase [Actinomycetota bacterium]